MSRNLYVTAIEAGSGKSLISLGLAELLVRRVERLGFFLEPVNWPAVRPMILTRRLLEDSRAHTDESNRGSWTSEETAVNDFLTKSNRYCVAADWMFPAGLSYCAMRSPERCRISIWRKIGLTVLSLG